MEISSFTISASATPCIRPLHFASLFYTEVFFVRTALVHASKEVSLACHSSLGLGHGHSGPRMAVGCWSSLVQLILPKNTKKHHCGKQQQKNVTFRTSLTGLSVILRNAIVIIFSRGVLQPSGIRRFGNGVSQWCFFVFWGVLTRLDQTRLPTFTFLRQNQPPILTQTTKQASGKTKASTIGFVVFTL